MCQVVWAKDHVELNLDKKLPTLLTELQTELIITYKTSLNYVLIVLDNDNLVLVRLVGIEPTSEV